MEQFPEEMKERAYKNLPIDKLDTTNEKKQQSGWVIISIERFIGRGMIISNAAQNLFITGIPLLFDNNNNFSNDVVMKSQLQFISNYTLKLLNDGLLDRTFRDPLLSSLFYIK